MPTGAIEVAVTELEVVDPNERIEPTLHEPMQICNFSTSSNISLEESKQMSMYHWNTVTIDLSPCAWYYNQF